MQSRILVIILLATLHAIAGLCITVHYRPDLNYGYRWTNSLFATLNHSPNAMIRDHECFIKKYFEPTLKNNEIIIINSSIEENNNTEIKILVENKKFAFDDNWGFFGNKDKYLEAKKMVDCIFRYSVFKYFIENELPKVLPNCAPHQTLSLTDQKLAQQRFEKFPEATFVKSFYDDKCEDMLSLTRD